MNIVLQNTANLSPSGARAVLIEFVCRDKMTIGDSQQNVIGKFYFHPCDSNTLRGILTFTRIPLHAPRNRTVISSLSVLEKVLCTKPQTSVSPLLEIQR